MHHFWDIQLVSIPWPWNPGWGSLEVIENYTIRSGTQDFLLTFYSSQRRISHRFRDKRRFPSKIAPPVYLTPRWRGSPWNLVSVQESEETRMMGLPDGRKSFKIGLAILIQYRHVIDKTPSQPLRHSKYALCISASCSKNYIHCIVAFIFLTGLTWNSGTSHWGGSHG